MKMKKIILGITIGLLLISCSSSESNSSNSSSNFMWRCKINGVLYQWTYNSNEEDGCLSIGETIRMKSPDQSIIIYPSFNNISTGTFNFSSSLNNNLCDISFENKNYSTGFQGVSMIFNISSISPTTPTPITSQNPFKIVGTFYGTAKSLQGAILTITDGSFVALKID